MSTPSICLLTDQKCGTDRTNKERKKEKSTLQWDQQNFEIFDRKRARKGFRALLYVFKILEIFWEIFWKFFFSSCDLFLKFFRRIFWRNFSGGIFLDEFFGETFWEDFFRRIFLEDYFERNFLWGLFCEDFGRNSMFTLEVTWLSRFCLNQGRKKKGSIFNP